MHPSWRYRAWADSQRTWTLAASNKKENSSVWQVWVISSLGWGVSYVEYYPMANVLFTLKCLQAQSEKMPIFFLTLNFIKLMPACIGLSLWGSCFSEVTFSCTVYFQLQWLDCRVEMNVRIVCWVHYQIPSFLRLSKRNYVCNRGHFLISEAKVSYHIKHSQTVIYIRHFSH